MTTIADQLKSLVPNANRLRRREVDRVLGSVREIPPQRLDGDLRKRVDALSRALKPLREVALFEARDNSGPLVIATLPARTTLRTDRWRKKAASIYLRALGGEGSAFGDLKWPRR